MGPGAAKAVDALVAAALSDGSLPVRQAARAALLVVDGGAATAGLESALADRDAAMRMRATEILEALGVRARGAASRLVELALCDPEETVRTSAAYAAAAVDEDGTTVPGLVRAFTAGGSEESIRAVPALAAHGPRAAAAVPALSASSRRSAIPRRSGRSCSSSSASVLARGTPFPRCALRFTIPSFAPTRSSRSWPSARSSDRSAGAAARGRCATPVGGALSLSKQPSCLFARGSLRSARSRSRLWLVAKVEARTSLRASCAIRRTRP
ncbi:MAG: hypothetical protein U0166_22670 [Acidobacteriota bacterium]